MPKKAKKSTKAPEELKKDKSTVSSKKKNVSKNNKPDTTKKKTQTTSKKSVSNTKKTSKDNNIEKSKVKKVKSTPSNKPVNNIEIAEAKTTKKKFSIKDLFNNIKKPKREKIKKKQQPKEKKKVFQNLFKKKDKKITKVVEKSKDNKKNSTTKNKNVKKENKKIFQNLFKRKDKEKPKKVNNTKKKFDIKAIFTKKPKKEKNKKTKTSKKKFNIKESFLNVKNNFTLSKKVKKALIIVAIVCGLILIVEGGYVIYHRIKIDLNTTYYDSLNSITIDESDIIAVGSSNFRYSHHYNYTNGLEKAKLIKYDKTGKMLLEKQYEKGINTTFSSVVVVDDGYVVVGSGVFSEEEQTNGGREAIIIKYDKAGNIVWEDFYQVVTNTRFNKVIATSDGYVVVGQSIYANMEMGNHTTGGGIIVKYDFDGNIVWYNNHGGLKSGNFNDIVEVDGNFYVVGKDGTDCGNLVKFDKNGKYAWHKNYRYTDTLGFSGIAYYDNSLYVVGSKKVLPEGTTDQDQRGTNNTDALLVKYNLKGKVLLEKTFGGSSYERYNSIVNYYDELYVVGHITSKDAGLKIETDGKLMTGIIAQYDKNGNMLRKEVLGGSNDDNLTDITTDGASLYISGYSNSKDGNIITSHNNGKDYFGKIIKLDTKFRNLLLK